MVARQQRSVTTLSKASGQRSKTWLRFRRHRLAVVALVVFGIITLAVLVGPLLSPYDPERIDFSSKAEGPSLKHPMGTDDLGRDQLVRVLVGGRLTLAVALATVAVALLLGTVIGATAGYGGGWLDNTLMRLVDVFYSLPGLFVLVLVVTMLGATFWTLVLTLALLRWMSTARLVRSSFLTLKTLEFVEAARVLGASPFRIVVKHVLPNALGPMIVATTLGMAGAILAESALSFLGLGFQPPQASWGRMLFEAQTAVVREGQWWRGFFPGLMIFLTVLSVNYLGDGLRDAFDARRVNGETS